MEPRRSTTRRTLFEAAAKLANEGSGCADGVQYPDALVHAIRCMYPLYHIKYGLIRTTYPSTQRQPQCRHTNRHRCWRLISLSLSSSLSLTQSLTHRAAFNQYLTATYPVGTDSEHEYLDDHE